MHQVYKADQMESLATCKQWGSRAMEQPSVHAADKPFLGCCAVPIAINATALFYGRGCSMIDEVWILSAFFFLKYWQETTAGGDLVQLDTCIIYRGLGWEWTSYSLLKLFLNEYQHWVNLSGSCALCKCPFYSIGRLIRLNHMLPMGAVMMCCLL